MKTAQERFQAWYIGTISGLIISGLILILISIKFDDNFWISELTKNLAEILLISGCFTFITERLFRDKIIDLLLSKVNLKRTIEDSGLLDIYSNYTMVDIHNYIDTSTKSIDIFHAYSSTWINTYYEGLKEKLISKKCTVRFILIDPTSPFVLGLAKQYGYENSDELAVKIQETTKKIIKLQKEVKLKNGKGAIQLYYHTRMPAYSLYRFDNHIISMQYKLVPDRTNKIPTLVCKNTHKKITLYQFYVNEINHIISEAKTVNLVEDSREAVN